MLLAKYVQVIAFTWSVNTDFVFPFFQQHSTHRIPHPYWRQDSEYPLRSLRLHCRLLRHRRTHWHLLIHSQNTPTCQLHVNVLRGMHGHRYPAVDDICWY